MRRSGRGLLAAAMLDGCSWLSNEDAQEATPVARDTRSVDIELKTARNVNPSALGQAQSIKLCVIETSQPGWVPAGVSDGAPCREDPVADGSLSHRQVILRPNETRRYHITVPAHQARWFVVGAEFQQINGARYLVEQISPAQAQLRNTRAGRNDDPVGHRQRQENGGMTCYLNNGLPGLKAC
ncbi:type VI secretion system lipoprotein TssJ [Pseudomonas chlororaphis]|uniref:Type VI secretion-associated protein n=1 Tax=Pseudomonas chlororaphis O6 TaxID=1037915 RepID=A0AB33X1B3_9PSED|nr:type VI secretion system lipoprotein TssJ [Pseudomonas chlororaphis]EIM18892.1 putative type VI secretion-associated protein [Pseudomonas chlororaphis O6]